MVRLENLTREQLQRLHEIVKPVMDPRTGKQAKTTSGNPRWKNVSKAAREFGVDRGSIWRWLKVYPEEPKAQARKRPMKPVAVQQFEQTRAWGYVKGDRYQTVIKNTLLNAWEYLDHIDPVTWNLDHYKALRKEMHKGRENPLYIAVTGDIGPSHATNIRRFLNLARPAIKDDATDLLKNVPKRPAGSRKNYYIDAPDIISLIQAINRLDMLIFTMVDLESGARPGAIAGGKESSGRQLPLNLRYTPTSIDRKRNIIQRWENKKRKWARAKHQTEHIDLLERYIKDMGIKRNEMIFPRTVQTYSQALKAAGIRGGVKRFEEKGAAAYVMRHTFATQALAHNVSIEAVMEQGGWKTASIITDFYAGLKESKLDTEFLDKKPEDELTWREWLSQFTPYFQQQYDKIIQRLIQDRKTRRLTGAPTQRHRAGSKAINWNRIKAWAESKKTPTHTREQSKKALKLHDQGLSDAEIRERMGWRTG